MNRITLKNKKIAVIFGGISGEHEVSLVSAEFILTVLKKRGYDVIPVGITRKGQWIVGANPLETLKNNPEFISDETVLFSQDPSLKGLVVLKNEKDEMVFDRFIKVDVIFPVLHGSLGEDGCIQGLFEFSGIPYVGCGVTSSACGMDKIVMKRLFASAGLNVVPDIWFTSDRWEKDSENILNLCEKISYPLFVKPANTGSSVGVSKAHDRNELAEAITLAAKYDVRIQVEKGIDNPREIEVAVIGNANPSASIPGEILPSNEFYDYAAKYESGTSKTLIPADLPEKLMEQVREMAKKGYISIGCEGLARVDFLLDPSDGKIYINELNTLPGFTSISMYPKLWEASGVSGEELIEKLLHLGLERSIQKESKSRESVQKTSWHSL